VSWGAIQDEYHAQFIYARVFLDVGADTGPFDKILLLTHPDPITRIIAHIGEPTSPPLIHPPDLQIS